MDLVGEERNDVEFVWNRLVERAGDLDIGALAFFVHDGTVAFELRQTW